MPKSYSAPELVALGSVSALTASFVKCTPQPDSGGYGHTHAEQDGVIVDSNHTDPNCLPTGQLSE